jgi:hypothetical protein
LDPFSSNKSSTLQLSMSLEYQILLDISSFVCHRPKEFILSFATPHASLLTPHSQVNSTHLSAYSHNPPLHSSHYRSLTDQSPFPQPSSPCQLYLHSLAQTKRCRASTLCEIAAGAIWSSSDKSWSVFQCFGCVFTATEVVTLSLLGLYEYWLCRCVYALWPGM